MRRKLILFSVMMLVTLVLAGCDFFGQTTTTTTTTTTSSSSTTTTTTTTTPTTTGTTTTEELFDRQDLINVIITMAGEELTEEQIEAQIDFYQSFFGVTSEEDLYLLLTAMSTVMSGFDGIETLTQMQDWYSNAKALGFDKEIITNMMISFVREQVNREVDNYDPSYYISEIARLNQEISDNSASMAQVRTNVLSYCTTADNQSDCVALYDAMVAEQTQWRIYNNILNDEAYSNNNWNWETYNNLEWNMDSVLYYTYYNVDSYEAGLYQDAYDTLYAQLSPEEISMYSNALNAHAIYATIEYRDRMVLESNMWNQYDTNDDYVVDRVHSFYYEYQNFEQNNAMNLWLIQELEMEQQREQQRHQVMLGLQAYLYTEAGATKVKLLMITLYDIMDSVVMGLDEGTFNFIMSVLKGEIQPDPSMLTSENIVLYTDMLHDVLVLIQSTIDSDDIANIKSLAQDIMAMYISTLGMDPADTLAMISTMNGIINQYVDVLVYTLADLTDFLGTIDTTKADAIIEFVTYMTTGVFTEQEVAIEASKLIDALIGDGSLDVSTLLNNLVEIYFDVNYMFMPDEATIIAVKAAAQANLSRMLELIALVKDYDSSALGLTELQNIDELVSRGQAFVMMFKVGFETILEPITFGYDHQDFLNLIYQLDGPVPLEDAEAKIVMFMSMFELTDEEQAYYMTKLVLNYAFAIRSIESFGEFQNWFARVTDLGFSNSAIAQYIVNFMILKLDQDINNDPYYQQDIDYYTEQIADAYAEIERVTLENETIFNTITDLINALPAELQADAWTYWNVKLTSLSLMDAANYAQNEVYSYVDWWTVQGLIDSWDNYQYFLDMEDTFNANIMLQNFNDLYNSLDFTQQYYVDQMMSTRDAYLSYWQNELLTIQFVMDTHLEYDTYKYYVMDNFQLYYNNMTYYIPNLYQNISYCNDQLDRLMAEKEQLTDYYNYLSDEVNEQLVVDVVTILIDEVQNIISVADPATFDIVFMLLTQGRFLPKTMMVVEEDPFETIDLSALAILGYTEDVSTVLKAMFATLSSEDVANIKLLLLDIAEIQWWNEGMSESEIIQNLALLSMAFDKYYPQLQDLILIITNALDGLNEQKIQTVLDAVALFQNMETMPSQTEMVVLIATLVNTLLADGTFALDDLIAMYIEVYYDVNTMFDYLPADLAATQAIFQGYYDQLLADAATIATYDPMMLTPEQVEVIYLAQQKLMYLFYSLQDPFGIDPDMVFGYNHEDFVSLLYSFMGCVSEEEVNQAIEMFTVVFDTDTEEEAFYMVLAYGSVLMNARGISSVEDAQAFLQMVFNLGVTKEDMAFYIVNFFIYTVVNKLNSSTIYADYMAALANVEDLETFIEEDIQVLANNSSTLELLKTFSIDPSFPALIDNAWSAGLNVNYSWNYYQQVYGESTWNYMFDYYTYQTLSFYYFGDGYTLPDMDAFNNMWSMLSEEQHQLYSPILGAYQEYLNQTTNFEALLTNIDSYGLYYNGLPVSDVVGMLVEQYIDINDELVMLQEELMYAEKDVDWLYEQYHTETFLNLFIGDAANLNSMHAAIVTLLQEADYLVNEANPNTIYFLMDLVQGNVQPGVSISIPDFLIQLQGVGALVGLIDDTMDPTELDNLNWLIDSLIYNYINAFGDNETTALQIIGVVDTYFDGAFSMIDLASSMLLNMTEDRLQAIVDAVADLEAVGDAEDNLSNFIRAVAIANIVMAVTEDPTLNETDLIANVFGAVFDMQYALGFSDSSDTATKVAEIQGIVANIMTQADVIDQYDPYTGSPLQIMDINQFRIYIESMITFIDSQMNPQL